MKNNFRILYFGNWGYGYAGLKVLFSMVNIQIIKVFTKWDNLNSKSYLNKVKDFCLENTIPFINSDKAHLSKNEFEKEILSYKNIDFIISCCYDRIFSKRILEMPNILPINIHPSILSKFRGIKPLENAIIHDKETGVTIHILTDELDSGDILLKRGGILLEQSKTYKELYEEQCELIEKLIKEFFNNTDYFISKKINQNELEASYAPRLAIEFNDNDTVANLRRKYLNIKWKKL